MTERQRGESPKTAKVKGEGKAWWYADRRGIDVIVDRPGLGLNPAHVRLPWGQLMKSAVRYGWKVKHD
jgi:hypothetical protein